MKRLYSFALATIVVLTGAGVALAGRSSVNADIANVRSGPDAGGAVVWQVEKYYPLTVIQKKGEWCLFEDFEGDRGWIHASLLSDTKTVIVKSDQCNVRSGPGTESDIRFTVDRGVPFKVLEEKGAWLHIEHADGDQGWIHRTLVW